MGQQVAACATVSHCCKSAEKGSEGMVERSEPSAALRIANLPPEVRLVAWLRRRSGSDCDFGEVFEEIFASRDAVGESKFASMLKERGIAAADAHASFLTIDRTGRGTVSAADFEAWQEAIEKRETEGLRAWRDWLRKRFTTPSAAYHAMGKGEGDVLVEVEFTESLARLGFQPDDPIELFRFIDKDFSGEVTFSEFKSAMRSVGAERVKQKAERRRDSRNGSRNTSKTSSPRQQQQAPVVYGQLRPEFAALRDPSPSAEPIEQRRDSKESTGKPPRRASKEELGLGSRPPQNTRIRRPSKESVGDDREQAAAFGAMSTSQNPEVDDPP